MLPSETWIRWDVVNVFSSFASLSSFPINFWTQQWHYSFYNGNGRCLLGYFVSLPTDLAKMTHHWNLTSSVPPTSIISRFCIRSGQGEVASTAHVSMNRTLKTVKLNVSVLYIFWFSQLDMYPIQSSIQIKTESLFSKLPRNNSIFST